MTTLPKLVKPYNNYSPLNKSIKMTNTMYNNFSNYNYTSQSINNIKNKNNKIFNKSFKLPFNNPLNEESSSLNLPELKVLKNINFIDNPIMDREIERLRNRQLNDEIFQKAIKKLTYKKKEKEVKRGGIRKRTIYGMNNQPERELHKKEQFILNKYLPEYNYKKINYKKDKHYSKNVIGLLNSKLFSGEIVKPWIALDIDSYEKRFEEEVKSYQLSKIGELNNMMNDYDNIATVNNIEDLEKNNFEETIGYGRLFHIRENIFNQNDINQYDNNNNLKLNLQEKDKRKDLNLFNKSKAVRHNKKNKELYNLFNKKDIKKNNDEDEEIQQFELHIYYCQNLTLCNRNKDGIEGINQDSFLQLLSINGNKKFHLFGVMDGHGNNGHIISKYVSRFIGEYITSEKNKKLFNKKSNEQIYKLLIKNKYAFINKLISECNNSLVNNSDYQCNLSGSTCLLIFIIENNLICANIGNSRAILLEKTELLQLSIDQTLSDPEEIKRILQKGGKVKQINKKIILENANNNDFEISRSIGDKKLKNIGIIYEPVITEYTLNRKSRFIIMGTQGLWNALSNEKAAIQVNKSIKLNNPLDSCRLLVKKAKEILNKASSHIDDITVITIILEETFNRKKVIYS
jgi:serine/threonine protein phosphatase PrpC